MLLSLVLVIPFVSLVIVGYLIAKAPELNDAVAE